MTDLPMIFSAPMVRALLAGRKTQTRRVLRCQPGELDVPQRWDDGSWHVTAPDGSHLSALDVRFRVGDRLYVRETCWAEELHTGSDGVRFAADAAFQWIDNTQAAADAWQAMFHYRGRGKDRVGNKVPPLHMPRWASRLTLTVTDVRVQRLQGVSEEDARAEGIEPLDEGYRGGNGHFHAGDLTQIDEHTAVLAYRALWNSLHGPDAWSANPWVAAISFTVERRNIDAPTYVAPLLEEVTYG